MTPRFIHCSFSPPSLSSQLLLLISEHFHYKHRDQTDRETHRETEIKKSEKEKPQARVEEEVQNQNNTKTTETGFPKPFFRYQQCHHNNTMYPSPDSDISIPNHRIINVEEDDDYSITRLIDSEIEHLPKSDYLQRIHDRSIDPISRQDSINWILKANNVHRFRPVTAYLSINYLDRFLSSYTLPKASNGWPIQLLSVACLSLAAKMEETHVPLLTDLQVSNPKYIFEPRTVGRMEVLVMSKLQWRLNSVTPFDFVDYFVSKLPFSCSCYDLLNRVSDLILKTTRVIDFMSYRPSIIAAAAVVVASCECNGENDREPITFHHRVSNEVVRSCHQLMEEYMIDTCSSLGHKHERSDPDSPQSPAGVLEAASCRSCDTSHTSEAESSNKRQRFDASDVQQL